MNRLISTPIEIECLPTRFIVYAHFLMALSLLLCLTMSFAVAAEPDGSVSTQDKFSERAMETRANAIQARCQKNESCAARNAQRLQQQADDFAKAKEVRAQRANTKGARTLLSGAQLTQRKQDYDRRCAQNKKCVERKAKREARKVAREEQHKQQQVVSRAFKAWCAADVAACDEYNVTQKNVFNRISAMQSDCEKKYDHCVTTLRGLFQAQREAWKPFCNANPGLCKDQQKKAVRDEKKRKRERAATCQAQPNLAVCDARKRNFSTALKEASASDSI